jgi:predicted regulator of Ras-like GTPase activity (Roadblock/LC7/MglB family)
MSDRPTSQASEPAWLLDQLVTAVPGARSAVLLSTDGIAKFWYGLPQDEAQVFGAMASGLCSIARGVGKQFGDDDGVRQVFVELNGVVAYVCAAGANGVLAVLAEPEADAGVLGFEMAQMVKRVPDHLSTPIRAAAAAPAAGLR